MLDEFGKFNFSKSQAKALIKAAKKAWDESGKTQFDLCFNLFQVPARQKGISGTEKESFCAVVHGMTDSCFFICVIDVGNWSGEKLRQLGSLVKGLDTDDIKKLGKEAFEEAVGVWGKYLDVDLETLKALADKAKEVRPIRN